jgi:hypothetical protein
MGFTNIDLVKKHILEHELGTVAKENIACRLVGETQFQLPHLLLVSGSEKVKAKESATPVSETVDFASSEVVQLANKELIPDTVVVASDSSLGQIYSENLDYTIDYQHGIITRIADGAIGTGASVVIWYLFFRLYVKDSDYKIDYPKGLIRRISSGDIEDGQWLLVDYSVEFALLSDEVMENAVKEASDQVLKYIDSSFVNSRDQSLATAETYLAVSILCNIRAMEAMTQNAATGSGGQTRSLSLAWAEMSGTYRQLAFQILEKFKRDPGGFCSPHTTRSSR